MDVSPLAHKSGDKKIFDNSNRIRGSSYSSIGIATLILIAGSIYCAIVIGIRHNPLPYVWPFFLFGGGIMWLSIRASGPENLESVTFDDEKITSVKAGNTTYFYYKDIERVRQVRLHPSSRDTTMTIQIFRKGEIAESISANTLPVTDMTVASIEAEIKKRLPPKWPS